MAESNSLREQIDRLAHQARVEWDEATKKAKAIEAQIEALEKQLEDQGS